MTTTDAYPKSSWANKESSRQRTQSAAQILMAKLADTDVREALAGRETRAGHPFDTYLLPPLSAEKAPKGRQLLNDLIEGNPVQRLDVEDLLLGINRALIEYQGNFKDLPKNARLEKEGNQDFYELVAPANGSTPHYLLHRGQRGKPDETDRYLSPEQKKSMESLPVGMALQSTRIILGNEREI